MQIRIFTLESTYFGLCFPHLEGVAEVLQRQVVYLDILITGKKEIYYKIRE